MALGSLLRNHPLFKRLFRQALGKTETSTDLNRSPRPVSINEPRVVPMSNASAKGSTTFTPLQKGGSVIARGNKLARSKPTKLY
ncbi:hypothetical protein EBR37_00825 [bacterium]|nr:hypothetical protein [bacterium]